MSDTVNLILKATIEYNKAVHSVTDKRPIDIINLIPPELADEIIGKNNEAREKQLIRINETRRDRSFKAGETVLVKLNKRLGNKLTPRYREGTIEADLRTKVLIKGRVVHKDNLR